MNIARASLLLIISVIAFAAEQSGDTCPIIGCCMDDCCGSGTAWDLDIQYCVPAPYSFGYNGTHASDYAEGCRSRVCCEQDCCAPGTTYNAEKETCLPLSDAPSLAPSLFPSSSPSRVPSGSSALSPTDLPRGPPSQVGECESAVKVSTTYTASFDTLIINGFDEDQITWIVTGTSPFTTFEFELPCANGNEVEMFQAAANLISTTLKDTSMADDTKLIIQGVDGSPLCSKKASVKMTMPRNCRTLCVNSQCRPVLCPLNYGLAELDDISFVPSYNRLLFGDSIYCQIVQPALWDMWVMEQFGNITDMSLTGNDMFFIDSDGDGLSNILEFYGNRIDSIYGLNNKEGYSRPEAQEVAFTSFYSTSGFNPVSPDTDRDLLGDGFEWLYGLDPGVVDDITKDSDQDGLTEFEEQKYSTDPFTADTDMDNISDDKEVADGSDPLSNRDWNTRKKTIEIRLSVGDHSGSSSERYIMKVGSLVHSSPEFGLVSTAVYNFTAGSYVVEVNHRDSILGFMPDFDYTAIISPARSKDFNVTIEDPDHLLGRWLATSVDRTIGKKARLIITELAPNSTGRCSYDSCTFCNMDDKCEWNERSRQCHTFDASLGFAKCVPQDCACDKCREWALRELANRDWISNLPQCPCSVELDQGTSMLTVTSQTNVIWHQDPSCGQANVTGKCHDRPGASACILAAGPDGTAQQCCYEKLGSSYIYLPHGTCGSGMPQRKMRVQTSIYDHYMSDMLPYDNCCEKCEEGRCGTTSSKIATACEMYLGRSDGTPGARSDERGCV